jgi:hypothetical protein
MGSQIFADSKLQYYPTSSIETTKILSVLGGSFYNKKEFRNEYDDIEHLISDEFYKNIDNRECRFTQYITNYICNNPKLHKYAECSNFGNRVVADLFAGEGEWLKLFKTMSSKPNILIGNELEENRYNNMISEGLIDYHYNLAFEDLKLPKRIIDIMLFNPPYGQTNGERNVRRYLRMILNQNIMSYKSVIVFVVKPDDLLNVVDLIAENCKDILGYKTHEEEFKKFGQIVLFAELGDKSLDLNIASDVAKYKEKLSLYTEYINQIKDEYFKPSYIGKKQYCTDINADYAKAFENFEFIKDEKARYSNIDKAWKWLIDDTKIVDLSEERLFIPKPLKSGELANVIASGRINGEIELEDRKAHHIAVGGVKQITTEQTVKTTNKKGETESKLETTIQNLPYLNLLINDNGVLKIKELVNNPNVNEESEESEE